MRYQSIVLVSLVISTSTGTLLRRLIIKTASHLVAFTLGFFWLLGEIIPCIALLLLIHRLLIDKRQDDEIRINLKNVSLTSKEIVIFLFVGLYSIELILVASCSLGRENNDCINTLTIYRNIFFHIQLYIALIYLLKPWNWTKIDLKNTLSMLGKLFISFSKRIDCTIISGSKSIKSSRSHSSSSRRKNPPTKSRRATIKKLNSETRKRVSRRATKVKSRVTAPVRCRSSSIKVLQNSRNLVRVQVFK